MPPKFNKKILFISSSFYLSIYSLQTFLRWAFTTHNTNKAFHKNGHHEDMKAGNTIQANWARQKTHKNLFSYPFQRKKWIKILLVSILITIEWKTKDKTFIGNNESILLIKSFMFTFSFFTDKNRAMNSLVERSQNSK